MDHDKSFLNLFFWDIKFQIFSPLQQQFQNQYRRILTLIIEELLAPRNETIA